MRVVIAPDSFKGSISARDAAAAIAAGWRSVRPSDDVLELPQADGGEGTLDAIEAVTPDAVRRSAGLVTGPDGRPVPGEWLDLPDGTAVVELAQCSGIALMERLDPLGATTRGLGEVIAAALESGAVELVIALGGSASTDGGMGALEALDLSRPPPRGVRLLTDVTAPLLGPTGAAAVYGPQKGATPDQIAELEERLLAFSSLYDVDPGTPGAGAAGGTAYGFLAAWNAVIQPGAPEIAGLTGLRRHLRPGGVLITGEGSFDATSTQGKVVGHGIQLAAECGVSQTFVIAGRFSAEPRGPGGSPVASIALVDLAGSTDAAIAEPARWLSAAGARAATQLEA
ncbi:MAG: glycerate kinase [Pseudolysinimonas sp.]|uniref:glycerate kinase n=1 Tax=Pseudolysinimonas sp. TaxID=2680009 RepID=UPI003C75C234